MNALNNNEEYYNDRIDLRLLFPVVWNHKKFIFMLTTLFAIASVFYSLSQVNIYTANTLLRPTASSAPNFMSQYGGLASLAGINLPQDSGNELKVALAIVNSKKLVGNLMMNDSFLPDLIAAKEWRMSTNTIIYDDNLYDKSIDKWVRKASPPFKQIPSLQEATQFFSSAVSINQDNKNNLVTLSVDHISPVVAQQWSIWIVREINTLLANMKVIESQASIDYLNSQIKITPYAELRSMFYELIQESTQSMMLAKVNPEYVLTTIDPPVIAETKSRPNRAIICILGTFLGGILSILIILIRYFGFNKKDEADLFRWTSKIKKA
jgi:LPS O-antigen subunit length determinant protein (WzzB/FepE family)